ncbi:hypothetical protein GTO27_00070 [Candidatus Bathyarchaeota archaeon]|nr:hypothetical protein [Candidatus Bathyarchaeota archaeon]
MQEELDKIKERIAELEEFKEDLEGISQAFVSDIEDFGTELQALRQKVSSFERVLGEMEWQEREAMEE